MKVEIKPTNIKDQFLLIIYNQNGDQISSQGIYSKKNELYDLYLELRDFFKKAE